MMPFPESHQTTKTRRAEHDGLFQQESLPLTRYTLLISCCLALSLTAGRSVAQTAAIRQPAVRAQSRPAAPEPPELVPHPAAPYLPNSDYDTLPTHAESDSSDPFLVPVVDAADAPFNLPEPRVDSVPLPASAPPETELEAAASSRLNASAIDPMPMLQSINSELTSAAQRESTQFDSLQRGLQKLRQANESMRERAQQDQKLLEAERRRARRAEQVAEDARQQAEQARVAAEETLRRFQELNVAAEPPAVEPTPIHHDDSLDQLEDATTPSPPGKFPRAGSSSPHEPLLDRESIVTSAVPIVDDSVDRESLANNLFGAKQYKLALQIYAELAKAAPGTEDELWYQYQLACCYRNLGNTAQAEKYYRIVAGRKDFYLAATARWYLSMIQEQKALKEQMASWELVLSRVDDHHKAQEK